MTLYRSLCAALLLSVAVGCGGGGNVGDDTIILRGTVRSVQLQEPISGVQVCALGGCSRTDSNGRWAFTLEASGYNGGDVLFSLDGTELNAQTVVPAIGSETEEVNIIFGVASPTQVEVESVDQFKDPTGAVETERE
ncbi:MAG: hypothetical protein U0136_21220 [Bdellovibrionota bacterium]